MSSLKFLPIFIFLIIGCGDDETHQNNHLESIITPNIGFRLGRGYDPTQPLNGKGDCLADVEDATTISWKDASGIRGRFSETQIKTMEQLLREVSISGSAAAESMWGPGSAEFSKYEKFNSDENSFTWVVNYVVDVGEKTLIGHKLKLAPRAQAFINKGDLESFYKMCGTEYIRSVKLGGKFTAVYEISSKYSELVKQMRASASASVGSWGFSGSASFNSYLKDAQFKSILKKEVSQYGGSKIDIEKINPENLGNYLLGLQEEMNKEKAVVVKVETASWDTIGVSGLNDFAKWNRKSILSNLYSHYRYNISLLNRITDYAYWQSEKIHEISNSTIQHLNSFKKVINSQQSKIAHQAALCIEQNKCEENDLEYINVNFPDIKQKMISNRVHNFSFQIDKAAAKFGRLINYDKKIGRLYSIPESVHSNSSIQQMDIFVYRETCESKEALAKKTTSRLKANGLDPIQTEWNNPVKNLSLTWNKNPIQRKILIFNKAPNQKTCAMIHFNVISNNDFDWSGKYIGKLIASIQGSLSYN